MEIALVGIRVETNGPLAAKIGSISNEVVFILLVKRVRQMSELRIVLVANKSNVHAISFLHESGKNKKGNAPFC